MKQGGFTLIELIVVISIISIMTTVVVFQQRDANDQFQLDNAANRLVSEIRKAQTYALGVQRYEGFDVDEQFDIGYGVAFRNGESSITFFADNPNTTGERYVSPPDKDISTVTFPEGITIKRIQSGITSVSKGSVVYKRPDPKAIIYINNDQVEYVNVILETGSGRELTVVINATGGIHIER